MHPAHLLLLDRLHARLVHLEDPHAVGELRVAQGVGVESGPQDHVLPDAVHDRFGKPVLRIARPQDVLGMDGVERPEQLVDDDPVEQAVVGDLPPERRHHPDGVGVVQDRVRVPAPVVRPDARRERRRAADPSRVPGAGPARGHAESIPALFNARSTDSGAASCRSASVPP